MEQLTVQNRRLKSKKTDMLKSIGQKSGGIRAVSPEEEKKGTVGRICRKGKFLAWSERVKG